MQTGPRFQCQVDRICVVIFSGVKLLCARFIIML